MKFINNKLVLAGAVAMALSGCGGSSSSSSSSSTEEVTGVVADGYLVNATVCLDLNGNKSCDAGEPSDTSGAGGTYDLGDVSSSDLAGASIIAVVTVGTTTDEDGNTISGDYVLSTPPGETNVNPITTMIQTTLESNPNLSKEDAEDAIKDDLGLTNPDDVDLFEDYVAAKDSGGANDEDYEKLHQIAQVTADVLEDQMEAVEAAAIAASLDLNEVFDEIVRMVVAEVIEQLSTIESAVETATSGDGELSEAEIDNISDTNVTDVETTDIADDIEAEQALSEAAASSMATALQNGITWIFGEPGEDEYEYGTLTVGGTGTITETEFNWNWELVTPAWEEDADSNNEYLLGSNGWFLFQESSDETITFSEDGNTATVTIGGVVVETVTGVETDLVGKDIQALVSKNGLGDAVPADNAFSEGAIGYLISFNQVADEYEIHIWDDPNCENNGNIVGTESPYCNSVNINGTNTTSLNELVTTSSAAGSCQGTNYLWIGDNLLGELVHTSESVANGDSGTLNVYDYNGCTSGEGPAPAVGSGGTWEAVEVNGELLIKLDTPAEAEESLWIDSEEQLLFAVHDGYVRQGSYQPAGSAEADSEWIFNDTAKTDVLNIFNPPAPAGVP